MADTSAKENKKNNSADAAVKENGANAEKKDNAAGTKIEKRTAAKGEVVIKTEHLTKRYGKKVAVNDLSLTIKKGEVFGLLGPNGAGKTTTILMLLGLTEPSGGTATIEGMNCTRDPLGVKSIVGYLPDNAGFYGDMTGRQNLRFTGRLNGLEGQELEERIETLLKRVDIEYAGDQKVGTYSRGMRQRLGVADVLMKDPEIIIMDEPTLGIDPEGMRKLLILIRELAEEDGRTILISSHQLQQVQQICDRVGIFIEGSLIVQGTLKELEEHIRKEGSYLLELSVEPLDDQLLGMLYQQDGVKKIEKEGDKFMITSKKDIRPTLTRFLGENGYTVYHLHQRGGDLDEIYRVYFEKAGQADERSSYEKNNKKRRRFGGKKKQPVS
ncbi:MAG: ABC transporter ATP-binding protein [Lachnospiraceae bacterium]|nr:ABC transporter ATP-binding protein [Lachnospiraceae bacterium]